MPRMHSLRHSRDGIVIESGVGPSWARELFVQSEYDGRPMVERHVEIAPSAPPLVLVVGSAAQAPADARVDVIGWSGTAAGWLAVPFAAVRPRAASTRPARESVVGRIFMIRWVGWVATG